MKIAFLVGQFPRLSETFILNQITGLLDRGHEVDIFASSPSTEQKVHSDVYEYRLLNRTYYRNIPVNKLQRIAKAVALFCVHFHKAPFLTLKSINFAGSNKDPMFLRPFYATVPFLQKGIYDIIHCHFGPNGNLGVVLRDLGVIKGKVVTAFHGGDISATVRLRGKTFYKDLFEKGDLFTAATDYIRNKLVDNGCHEKLIVKQPSGINIKEFSYKNRELKPGEPLRIFTVGRLVEKKGIEYSIRAVGQALNNFPRIQYGIAGDGPLRNKLQHIIKELRLENQVTLLGWRTQGEIRELYDTAHIFVLSSVTASTGDQEGQALVLQEAQAMGLPVISTFHNGIPEGVLDGKSGFLVPERDVDALAERLEYLLQHPGIWSDMGRTGRDFVGQYYNVDKLNDQLVEIYRNLLESPH